MRGAAILLLAAICVHAAACTPPIALTLPVVKLALIAPFEGRERATGYEALYAVKLAIREHNASAAAGARVELLALDNGSSSDLVFRQARALAVDPDVRAAAIITPASLQSSVRAAYESLHVPLAFIDPASPGRSPDSQFTSRYISVSGGAAPGALAVQVYDALSPLVSTIGRPAR